MSQTASSVGAADIFNVNGLVAVVTGGGTGIGLMITKALAHNGAKRVYILGRREPVLVEAAASINSSVIVPIVCDVTSQDSLASASSVISQAEGYIDLLICNSGIGGPLGCKPTPETTLDEYIAANLAVPMEEYTHTFTVNTTSVWYTTMNFLKLLDAGNKQRHHQPSAAAAANSQVIAISSIGGFNKLNAAGYAYQQSKAACTHLAKQLAVALPQWGIRANVICPGIYPSEMSAKVIAARAEEAEGGPVSFPPTQIPLQRAGNEQDMAGVVLYLASRAGAYCNGAVVTTDGGRLGVFPSTF